jgi:hypothetical protein
MKHVKYSKVNDYSLLSSGATAQIMRGQLNHK